MKFRSHLFWRIRGCIERPLLFNLLFVGTVFGAVDIRRSVVFEHENESARGSLRINHAATLEVIDQGIQFSSGKRLQNQRLVCAAFGGSFESSGDNIIWISISDDGGVNWSSPQIVTPEKDESNPEVSSVIGPNLFWVGTQLWLSYAWKPEGGGGSLGGTMRIALRESIDGGLTWSEQALIKTTPDLGSTFRHMPVLGQAIHLTENSVGFPFYYRFVGNRTPHYGFMVSENLLMGNFQLSYQPNFSEPLSGDLIEPVGFRQDSSIYVYFRTNLGEIYWTRSLDLGQKWTDPVGGGIPNPDSFSYVYDHGETKLLALNNSGKSRDNLVVLGGRHAQWETIAHIDRLTGIENQVSYPSVRVDKKENVHVVYTKSGDFGKNRWGDISYASFAISEMEPIRNEVGKLEALSELPTIAPISMISSFKDHIVGISRDRNLVLSRDGDLIGNLQMLLMGSRLFR